MKASKRTWTRQQRMRYKLTIARKQREKQTGRSVDLGVNKNTSLTHTPLTRLFPRFRSQVSDIDAIFNRFKNLGPYGRKFIISELLRYDATAPQPSEVN